MLQLHKVIAAETFVEQKIATALREPERLKFMNQIKKMTIEIRYILKKQSVFSEGNDRTAERKKRALFLAFIDG